MVARLGPPWESSLGGQGTPLVHRRKFPLLPAQSFSHPSAKHKEHRNFLCVLDPHLSSYLNFPKSSMPFQMSHHYTICHRLRHSSWTRETWPNLNTCRRYWSTNPLAQSGTFRGSWFWISVLYRSPANQGKSSMPQRKQRRALQK